MPPSTKTKSKPKPSSLRRVATLNAARKHGIPPRPRSKSLPGKLSAEDEEDTGADPSKMGVLRRSQWLARESFRDLKSTESSPNRQWTPEAQRVLSDNVRQLFHATSDPVEDQADWDKEDEDGDEDAGDGSPTEAQAAQNKSSKSRKRQRSGDTAVDADDPTTESKRPWKKSRMRSSTTQYVPKDLATLKPQPLQYMFESHPHEDRSDEWFVEKFEYLYQKIGTFSHEYFGLHDLDQGEFHQPWAAGMTPEFIRHVEKVAEADPADGGWDKLLRNTIQRQWLIGAIIMRILEKRVFGADLWGAEPQEKELLLSLEKAFIAKEGFSRTAVRSEIVRTIIGSGAITQNFHSEVAKLTAKVALLLSPLTHFLYSRPPRDGGRNYTIEEQYQELHNIISDAAYLSLCIRLSPTIIFFSHETPNTPFDEDEGYVDVENFTKSKQAVVDAFKKTARIYKQKKNDLENAIARFEAAGKGESRSCKRIQAQLNAHLEEEPAPPTQTHEALAKIAIWPSIGRYRPGTKEDDDIDAPLDDRLGFRIFDVCPSVVVYYFGVRDRVKRYNERVALQDFVDAKIKKYGKKESVVKELAMTAVTAVAAAAIPYLLYGWTLGP